MDTFAAYVKGKIDEQIEAVQDSLSRGDATDFPAYRQLVGKLEGLKLAKRELIEADSQLHRDPDDF